MTSPVPGLPFDVALSPHASMNDVATVLIVDDEEGIRASVSRALQAEGHLVEEAEDGAVGLAKAIDPRTELVILDLGLPRLPGDEVLEVIRAQRPDLPVLVLTARDGVDDRVRALDSGAVDYVVKPFALAELMARVRLRLRTQPPASSLQHGRVRLDIPARTVEVDGEPVSLSTQEFAVLQQFMQHPEEVLSRSDLLRSVWGLEQAPRRSNLVDVAVASLRRRLGADCIETVRGAGYRFLG